MLRFFLLAVLAVVGIGPTLIIQTQKAGPPTSGMTLWVNGRTGITTGTTFTWADQSGAGHNFSKTSGTHPTNGGTINGKNAVTFTATPSALTGGATTFSNYTSASSPFTWSAAAVFQTTLIAPVSQTGFPQYAPQIWGGALQTAPEWVGIGASAAASPTTSLYTYTMQWDTAQKNVLDLTASATSTPHYMFGYYDGTNLNVAIDSTTFTTSAASANTLGTQPVSIGGQGFSGDQAWAGNIGEIMVWGRVLAPSEWTAVQTFLLAQWGAI